MVYLVAVTGGIASGKSSVSRRLAEHGAHVIDADLLAREAVAPGSRGLAAIAERFGSSVLTPAGDLDRRALARVVFSDSHARESLNQITHPEVRRLARERIAQIDGGDASATVVYDVPLLVEARGSGELPFDLIVVVHARRDQRVERLISLRGMTRDEAESRVDAQASDAERLALADVVIDATGTLDETMAAADELWGDIRVRAEQSSSARAE